MNEKCYKCKPEDFEIKPGCVLPICKEHMAEMAAPKEGKWERLFDKRFGMLKYVTQDEIDGVFVIEKDRRMVKSFIREHFIPKERVEKLKAMRREGLMELEDPTDKGQYYYSCKTCGGYDDCDCSGYNQALDDVLSLLSEDKE